MIRGMRDFFGKLGYAIMCTLLAVTGIIFLGWIDGWPTPKEAVRSIWGNSDTYAPTPAPQAPIEAPIDEPIDVPLDPRKYGTPPLPNGSWSCDYQPTMNDNWHDDVICTNGIESFRPELLVGQFVTEYDMRLEAAYYEDYLNAQ